MRRTAVLVAFLALTGCGSGEGRRGPSDSGSGGHVTLKALCPGVHYYFDRLVASEPVSQSAFVSELERFDTSANAVARAALAPVIAAAKTLEKSGVGPDFSGARDANYAAISDLSAKCSALGSPILHGGPHPGSP
jgi:hypothetical protein